MFSKKYKMEDTKIQHFKGGGMVVKIKALIWTDQNNFLYFLTFYYVLWNYVIFIYPYSYLLLRYGIKGSRFKIGLKHFKWRLT